MKKIIEKKHNKCEEEHEKTRGHESGRENACFRNILNVKKNIEERPRGHKSRDGKHMF